MKINQAITYFLTALEMEQLSIHSLRAYTQDLHQFSKSTQKSFLEELTFEDFQDYFMTINHLKITTIKRKRVVLHRFLKFCYKKKMCSEKLHDYIDPIKSKKTSVPKEVLTKDEIHKLFTYLNSESEKYATKLDASYKEYLYYCSVRNKLLISTLLYTGGRANEVVSIKKQDIDLEDNTLTLFTKGQKYNQVPIHTALREAFELYNKEILVLKDDLILEKLNSDFLFPSRSNPKEHLSTRTLHDLMNKLSDVIGRHLHAHLFRHTFASYCIAANMDISTISSLISHSNPSITLSIYTHEIDAHNKQEQIKKLPSFI